MNRFLAVVTSLGLAGVLVGCAGPRIRSGGHLGSILTGRDPAIDRVLAAPAPYRVQILISEVVPGPGGRAALRRWGYRVDAEYFYPASSIKLGAAIAALQVIEELGATEGGIDLLEAPIEIAPLFPGDSAQVADPTELNTGRITAGHEIRKMSLVSDNQAFNRLFDLVGHEELNRRIHALGLRSAVINHRLSESRSIPNLRATASVTFHPPGRSPVVVPARTSRLTLTNNGPGLQVGAAFLQGTNRISTPMDFTARNGIGLVDLQDLLIKLVRPDIDIGTPTLKLRPEHRNALLLAMTQYPRESANPRYPADRYPDEAMKFLLPGIRRVFPNSTPGERIECTGKIGRAYGFSVENCYLRNPGNERAVFVSAALYTNADEVLNDDRYDYSTVADPFMVALGEVLAKEWLR